ncbi:hypothetical protein [Pseudomonas sp. C1C7]|nr:hypothetical protein [Pseudomonas sp. C1C7]
MMDLFTAAPPNDQKVSMACLACRVRFLDDATAVKHLQAMLIQ